MILIYYLLFVISLFVVLVLVLEYIKRRSMETIRAGVYNAFLSYYEAKVDTFCKDKEVDCKEKLSAMLTKELARQIEQNKIEYVDIEKLYESSSDQGSN